MAFRRTTLLLSFAFLAGAAVAPLHAQPSLPALHPAGVEFSVGAGSARVTGLEGTFGVSLSAMLAWHARNTDGNRDGWQVAVSASQHLAVSAPVACALVCSSVPNLRSLGVLGGWSAQRANLGPSVRALVGPAYVRSEFDAQGLGVHGRFDVSTHTRGRVALVAFGQWLVAPNLRDGRYVTHSYGIGWRVR